MRFIKRFLPVLFLSAGALSAQTLTSTNLPIVIINTQGGVAVTSSQVQADFSIIDNASGTNTPTDAPAYQGLIGVDFRGAVYPKMSYNVETWDAPGNSVDTPLLGMPSENDWVLEGAYVDRSLMRTLLAYHTYTQMGFWAPRMKYCEVLINGAYQGVYLFGENVKKNQQRLDIAKLNAVDNTGEELTGGYIVKIDQSNDAGFLSGYSAPYANTAGQGIFFHNVYPKSSDITGIQGAYIHNYVDSFEDALNGPDFQDTTLGWRAFGSHNWWEKFEILNEAFGNSEAYRLNTYLWKDKSKKLRIGPPWSVNECLYNTTNCNAATDTAWMYHHALYCPDDTFQPAFWWYRFQQDTAYVKDVRCQYTAWREAGDLLDTTGMFAFMDSVSTYLNAGGALTRNFQLYPIFGVNLINEPAPMAANHGEEVQHVKDYLHRRLQFLDGQWLSSTCSADTTATGIAATQRGLLSGAALYPNPASGYCNLRYSLAGSTYVAISLRNVYGQEVLLQQSIQPAGSHTALLDIAGLPAGLYELSIATSNGGRVLLKLVKE